jgi:hypothetical protein
MQHPMDKDRLSALPRPYARYLETRNNLGQSCNKVDLSLVPQTFIIGSILAPVTGVTATTRFNPSNP